MLLGIIKLTLLQNKALCHIFVWLEIILPILLFLSKLFFFFRDCRSIQFFKLLCWQRKSLICREKSLWELRWPITVTTKTKWNTVKKEILINQKFCSQIKRVCFQFEKVCLQRKNIKSQRKKICLHTQNKPTANSCGKFPRQIATAYFQGK